MNYVYAQIKNQKITILKKKNWKLNFLISLFEDIGLDPFTDLLERLVIKKIESVCTDLISATWENNLMIIDSVDEENCPQRMEIKKRNFIDVYLQWNESVHLSNNYILLYSKENGDLNLLSFKTEKEGSDKLKDLINDTSS